MDRTYKRSKDIYGPKRNTLWNEFYNSCAGNVKIKILFEFDNKKEAENKEIDLIKLYGRISDETGVLANIANGGAGGKASRKIIEYDKNGLFVRVWKNGVMAGKNYGITQSAIQIAISKKRSAGGSQWRYYDDNTKDLSPINGYVNNGLHPVYQFDLLGNLIQKYDSVSDAARLLNVSDSSISGVAINGKNRKTAHGFLWSYTHEPNIIGRFKIIQLDLKLNKVNEFVSMKQVREVFKISSDTGIRDSINSLNRTAYGFIWRKEYIKKTG